MHIRHKTDVVALKPLFFGGSVTQQNKVLPKKNLELHSRRYFQITGFDIRFCVGSMIHQKRTGNKKRPRSLAAFFMRQGN
jgi:hypothetical protein